MLEVTDRISGAAIEAYQCLTGDQQRDIDAFLEANPKATLYTREDLVNAWLGWNGIIGYTRQIIRLVQLAHEIKELPL